MLLQLFSELSEDSGLDSPAESVGEDVDGNGSGTGGKRLSASSRAFQAILAWFQVSLLVTSPTRSSF